MALGCSPGCLGSGLTAGVDPLDSHGGGDDIEAVERLQVTLGEVLTDESGIFELYVPADRPQDAKL
jgi:hypothetical protein